MTGGPYREADPIGVPLRCLRCGQRIAGETCTRCGAPAPARDAERAAELRVDCPRCGIALEASRIADWGAGFVYCVGCHGCFVPPRDWELLVDYASPLGRVAGDELTEVERGPNLRSDVPCPVCRATMERVRYAGEDLSVDVCDLHGIWFDALELAAALRATEKDDGMPVKPSGTREVALAPDALIKPRRLARSLEQPVIPPQGAELPQDGETPPSPDPARAVLAFVKRLFS